MDVSTFPTKSNLICAIRKLELSKQGYSLLDKKRNILINEMMSLIEKAEEIQSSIDSTFSNAYRALQRANVSLGASTVQQVGYSIPEETNVEIRLRSVMGVEIPKVIIKEHNAAPVSYSFFGTNYFFDEAYENFNRVKKLTIELAEIENTICRLADHIKKTQKRANALKSIIIPRYQSLVKFIQDSIEEKEREEFTRLHVIKERNSK
ncbi:MAG TPA: V-type ATP synthase subunit D [Clostridiaceae bacterium]|nr:V-type ATP synthase subunit D [Clostridiaceae bacterium]